MTNFDFNEWSNLYKVDPAAFEQRRDVTLEEALKRTSCPETRLSLEQTLFRIRMVRQRSKSPLQSAMEASKLMWESFAKLKAHVEQLQELAQAPLSTNGLRLIDAHEQPANLETVCANSAKVIPFKASNKHGH